MEYDCITREQYNKAREEEKVKDTVVVHPHAPLTHTTSKHTGVGAGQSYVDNT